MAQPGTSTVLGHPTVTNSAAAGYVTAYPCDQVPPTASNINFAPGQTVANFAAVHPDSQGDICLYSSAATDLLWDQTATTNALVTTSPTRLLDTRHSTSRLG